MDIDKLSQEEAKKCIGSAEAGELMLLDVRTQDEWDAGRAKGAIHFELSRLEAGEMPNLPKDAKICTYCAAGGRAETAKNILIANGFLNVKNFGGLRDWKLVGGEIVK